MTTILQRLTDMMGRLDSIAGAIQTLAGLETKLSDIEKAIDGRETISDELTAVAQAITNRETISDELTAVAQAITNRETISDELTAVAQAITGRETISDELTAVAQAITGRETISDELTTLGAKLDRIADGLSCVCNAVRDWSWSTDNPPVNYPSPPAGGPLPDDTQLPSDPELWLPCKAGYAYINALASSLQRIADFAATPVWSFVGLAAALATVTVFVASGGTATIAFITSVGVAASLWSALGDVVENGVDYVVGGIAEELRTNAELRACMAKAFVDGDGVADKVARIKGAIADRLTNQNWVSVAQAFVTDEAVQSFAYGAEADGELVFPQADANNGCLCLEPLPELPAQYVYRPVSLSAWTVSPDDANNNVVSTETYENGLRAVVDIRRSATYATATANLRAQMETRQAIINEYGGSPQFVGLLVAFDDITQSPTSPSVTKRIPTVNNWMLNLRNYAANDLIAYLVTQAQGAAFANAVNLGSHVIDYTLSDSAILLGGAPILSFDIVTPSQAEYVQYRVTYGLLRIVAVWKIQ